MPRRIALVLCVAIACATIAGCASSSAGSSDTPSTANPNVITAAELAATSSKGDAYELIRRLRPTWGTTRAATSFTGSGSTRVSVDGGQLMVLDALQQLQVSQLQELRLLSATDASQRFGTASAGGKVILVTRK